jgi:hypothetical protein
MPVAVAAVAMGLLASAAQAQSPSPTNGDATPAPWLNLRVYPLDTWGPVAGWGVGAGLVLHNSVRAGDAWLLTAAPAIHESVATLSYASAPPDRAATYVLADVRARTTGRQWFYGTGPQSTDDSRVGVAMHDGWLRVRVGRWLHDRRVLLQPRVLLRHHRVRDTYVDRGVPFAGASASRFQALPDPSRNGTQWGVQAGLRAAYDTRDRRRGATRGLLFAAAWERYAELSDGDVQVDRLTASAHGVVPLGGRHRLALRLQTAIATDRGDAVVPFYLLPKLDGRQVPGWAHERFFGFDRLAASALYRFPIARLQNLFAVGGHVGVHAASVYDDLGEQFALDLSFQETLAPPGSDVPLRPALSTGVRLGPLFRDETYFDLALGVSPEGITGVRFQFVRALGAVRPPHHNGATW